jgi:acetolactate synthase-1/2/3 large subunit
MPPVACVTGEGSIQMCIQELSTCKQFRLPVKIINLNNRISRHGAPVAGDVLFGKRYSQSYVTSLPDFVKLAEAYGHVGMRIEKPEDVEPALRKAFTEHKDDLVFMDFITDPGANVFPMVAAGKGLTEMILAEDL